MDCGANENPVDCRARNPEDFGGPPKENPDPCVGAVEPDDGAPNPGDNEGAPNLEEDGGAPNLEDGGAPNLEEDGGAPNLEEVGGAPNIEEVDGAPNENPDPLVVCICLAAPNENPPPWGSASVNIPAWKLTVPNGLAVPDVPNKELDPPPITSF